MELTEAVVGLGFVLLIGAVTALTIGPSIWGLVDVSRYPEGTWEAVGRKKKNWVIAFAIGTWAWFVGIPAAIMYLRKVRPQLQHAATEVPETIKPAWSRRRWTMTGTLIAGLWLAGGWAYLTHGHDEFFDDALTQEAIVVCADAKAALEDVPPLGDAPSFDDRADRVQRSLPIYEDMVTRLRSLRAPDENEAFDHWLQHWRDYLDTGRAYADAIRTGDPDIYEPAGNAGDRPATEMNSIARVNNMDACIF